MSLLRRLGLGLLTVSARGRVVPVLDPAPYRPRSSSSTPREASEGVRRTCWRSRSRRLRLRPTSHGLSSGRASVRRELAAAGVLKVSALSDRTGVSRAGPILRDNHYGWFDRVKGRPLRLVAGGTRTVAMGSRARRLCAAMSDVGSTATGLATPRTHGVYTLIRPVARFPQDFRALVRRQGLPASNHLERWLRLSASRINGSCVTFPRLCTAK